jgi:hypothetical protein
VKHLLPSNLRKWEERAAARKVADALLRADRRRQRRMSTNDQLGGDTAPAPVKKREDGPFAALKHHPLYRTPRAGALRQGRGPKEI